MAIAVMLLAAAALDAQEPPRSLSLQEAVRLARQFNPDYLAQRNNEDDATWGVRQAYGAFLPSAQLSGGVRVQNEGNAPLIGTFSAGEVAEASTTPGLLFSDYAITLGYSLSGQTFYNLFRERANRRSAAAGTDAALVSLDMNVTLQYLAALRARDAVELARRELERTEENLKLAEARVRVGAAIPLETMQAEVERTRTEVELLRTESLYQTEKLRLMQILGVEIDRDVELTSRFEVFEPEWSLDALLTMALRQHPQLRTLAASADAADAAVGAARSQYLPSLSVTAGWSGFTRQVDDSGFLLDRARSRIAEQRQQCQLTNQLSDRLTAPLPGTPVDCSVFALTSSDERLLLQQNEVFPFNFTNEPFSTSIRVSLPVFQGLSRQREVERARVAKQDVEYQLRAEELRLRAEIEAALLDVETAERAVALEQGNVDLAAEQLRLERERYRVGAISFVQLLESETIKARADRAFLVGVYAFHEALTRLEAAVGRSLRRVEENR